MLIKVFRRAFYILSSSKLAIVLLTFIFAVVTASQFLDFLKTNTAVKNAVIWGAGSALILNILLCTLKRVKNINSFKTFGSALFHSGIIISVSGFLISQVTGFSAEANVLVGGSFENKQGNYLIIHKSPFYGMTFKPFLIHLHKFNSTYHNGYTMTDVSSKVAIYESNKKTKDYEIKINRPLKYGGMKFVYAKSGYAPNFTILYKDIGVTKRGTVILESKDAKNYADYFRIPHTNYRMKTIIYPDFDVRNGQFISKSYNANNPRIFLSIMENDKPVNGRLLGISNSMEYNNIVITFNNLEAWNRFFVSSDNGYPIALCGFVAGMLGLSIRLLKEFK